MKNLFLLLLFMGVLFASCKDNETESDLPSPLFESITPALPAPGDEVTIKGQHFGTDITKIEVQLAFKEISITHFTDMELRFTVPEDFLLKQNGEQEYEAHVKLQIKRRTGSLWVNICDKNITIQQREPKGWFHQKKFADRLNGINVCLTATSDTCIWVVESQSGMFRKSTNGGNTWTVMNYPFQWGFSKAPAYFIDDNTAWFASNGTPSSYCTVSYLTDGEKAILSDIPNSPAFEISEKINGIEALWAKSYNTGLVMLLDGTLFGFRGSFLTGTVEYKNNDLYFNALSAIGMDEYTMLGYTKKADKKTKLIHKKKSGSPVEYDITQYIAGRDAFKYTGSLQHMKDGSVYISDQASKNLYHITWPFQATKLNQKADMFHFVNNDIAYAVLGNTIYKTVDAGKTWNKEFTVDTPYILPTGITEHNGRVWVLMEDGADAPNDPKHYMLVKYNP